MEKVCTICNYCKRIIDEGEHRTVYVERQFNLVSKVEKPTESYSHYTVKNAHICDACHPRVAHVLDALFFKVIRLDSALKNETLCYIDRIPKDYGT